MGIVVREHKFEVGKAVALSQKIAPLLNGEPSMVAEMALLITYIEGADGVKAFPESSRTARAQMLLVRGAAALCGLIAEIGALSDADVTKQMLGVIPAPSTTH